MVRALGGWENKVTVTTPEDIGRLTAMIVFAEPKVTDEIVFIAGETISYGELADIVDQTVGRKVRREVRMVDRLKEDLKRMQRDNDEGELVGRYRVVFAEGRGMSWDKSGAWNAERGVGMTGIREFAEKKWKGDGK